MGSLLFDFSSFSGEITCKVLELRENIVQIVKLTFAIYTTDTKYTLEFIKFRVKTNYFLT